MFSIEQECGSIDPVLFKREIDRLKRVFWSADIGLSCDPGKLLPLHILLEAFWYLIRSPDVAFLHTSWGSGAVICPAQYGRLFSPVIRVWPLQWKMLLCKVWIILNLIFGECESVLDARITPGTNRIVFLTLAREGTSHRLLWTHSVNVLLPPSSLSAMRFLLGSQSGFRASVNNLLFYTECQVCVSESVLFFLWRKSMVHAAFRFSDSQRDSWLQRWRSPVWYLCLNSRGATATLCIDLFSGT